MANYHGSAGFGVPQGKPKGRFVVPPKTNELSGEEVVFGFAQNHTSGLPSTQLISEQIKKHFLTVAPTRGGKGVSLIIPNLLNYEGSVVVIDPKGENAWITAKHRQDSLGQKVFVLDPWGEVKRRYGDKMREFFPTWWIPEQTGFNPLSILNHESENYSEDLAYISESLIINQGAKDPFFDDAARELVSGLISYMVETAEEGEEATLNGLRILLSNSSKNIAALALDAQSLGPNSLAARKLARFTNKSSTNDSIIITAVTQTIFLDSSALNKGLEGGKGVFDSLVECPTTIYLVLPVDKLQTYGRWLRLLVSIGIRSVSCHAGKFHLPVLFMLDEFGTIGKLSAVAQAFGLMAGLNMSVWAFVQDLTQLKDDYGDKWETFIANSQAITFWGVTDQFTAEYFSTMMGTATVEIKNISFSESGSSSHSLGQAPGGATLGESFQRGLSQSTSVQHVARRLMLPEEIREAPQELAFLLGNHKPYAYFRTIYHENPFFASRANPDPNHPESIDRFLKLAEKREKEIKEKTLSEIKKGIKKNYQTSGDIRQFFTSQYPDFSAVETLAKSWGWDVKKKLFGGIAIFKDKTRVFHDFKNQKAFYIHIINLLTDTEHKKREAEEEARIESLAQAEYDKLTRPS